MRRCTRRVSSWPPAWSAAATPPAAWNPLRSPWSTCPRMTRKSSGHSARVRGAAPWSADVDLQGAAQAVVDRLMAAGVQATVDERDLNPPAVLVTVPLLSYRFGKESWTAQFTLAAVVPNSGRATALGGLSVLLDQ